MNDLEKWHFLRSVPSMDQHHPKIKRLAADLWDAADAHARRFALLAHTVARDWIHQQSDTVRTGGEDIAGLTRHPSPDDAVDALDRGTDDCDAKARLFVALCLAVGLPARMVDYWRTSSGTMFKQPGTESDPRLPGARLFHVAAEVHLGNDWLPVELTLARARLGEPGELVPVEPGSKKWLNP